MQAAAKVEWRNGGGSESALSPRSGAGGERGECVCVDPAGEEGRTLWGESPEKRGGSYMYQYRYGRLKAHVTPSQAPTGKGRGWHASAWRGAALSALSARHLWIHRTQHAPEG